MTKEIRYFQNYLSNNKNLSINTINAYTTDLLLLEQFLTNKNILLVNATNEDINEYLITLDTSKTKTYNRKITSIMEFYRYLISYDININLNINRIYHIKNDKVYPRIIKFEDIKNMITCLNNDILSQRNKAIIMMLYVTGLRVSELINLTFNDINLNEGYIRCIGKGDKERIINVGNLLSLTLYSYINETRDLILNGLESNYLFVNSEGKKLTRQTIYNVINETAKKANIKLNVTPHTLRHCFATHMIENGADIRSVQELLGHSSITTTQVYLNISNQTLKDNYFAKFKDPLSKKVSKQYK